MSRKIIIWLSLGVLLGLFPETIFASMVAGPYSLVVDTFAGEVMKTVLVVLYLFSSIKIFNRAKLADVSRTISHSLLLFAVLAVLLIVSPTIGLSLTTLLGGSNLIKTTDLLGLIWPLLLVIGTLVLLLSVGRSIIWRYGERGKIKKNLHDKI